MAAERVNRLIALSSIAVYGEAAGRVGETTAPAGALDAYARGKLACETLYRSWASEAGRAALVLRPGIVYGAGSRFWIDKLAARIRAGAWGEFGARGEGIAPLIHAADAAGFIALAAGERLADARSRTINLVGPETPSWNAYFRALADTLGAAPLPCWSARELAARQALAIGAKAWTRLGLPGARAAALAPSAGEIALFSRKAQYSTGAARALGFAPRIGLAEGLARSRIG
jgi:nucleoside-diphosphate-sugar epimerase